MRKWKVVISDRLKPPADIEQEVLGKNAKIVILQAKKEEQILKEVEDADALLVWHEIKITKKSLSRMKKCKIIVRVGVGFDNVDIAYAGKRKIYVCNVPDYGTSDVADHTFALILAIYRNMEELLLRSRRGKSGWSWEGILNKRLTHETIGIVGLGRIGTAVALRAKVFGIRVIFYDPYVPRGIEKSLNLERKDNLYELLGESDIVSLHVPLTEETKDMADRKFFISLKIGAVIINTARGAIIDFQELYKAMKKDIVWAAGIDVLPFEPPNEEDLLIKAWKNKENWIRNRLLITPHCAFYSQQAYVEMRKKAAEEVKRVLKGELPYNCVNTNLRES